ELASASSLGGRRTITCSPSASASAADQQYEGTQMSRTNRINRLVALSVMISVGALVARSAAAAPPPNPEDLTQGKWELNVEKSKFCNPATAPKKSGRENVDVGWGMISVKQTGMNAKGQPTEGWYVYRYDGGKYPANIDRVPTEYIV